MDHLSLDHGLLWLACSLALRVLGFGLAWLTIRTLYRGIKIRMQFRRMAKDGLPVMRHSFLFGHMPLAAKFRKSTPADLHLSLFFVEVSRNWQNYFPDQTTPPSVAYVDLWPFANPAIINFDPAVSPQFTQTHSLRKASITPWILSPLTDAKDLATLEGSEWKLWRSRFNPGFSIRNLTALIPTILEEVDIFVDQLKQSTGPEGAWGDVFQLENKAMNLTFDVIGRAALDVKFDAQTRPRPSPFKEAFFRQIGLIQIGASLKTFVHRRLPSFQQEKARNAKVMDDFLIPYVQDRRELVLGKDVSKPATEKFVIDLAIQAIEKDGGSSELVAQKNGPLMQSLLAQLKVFLFAGHDTTATAIAWALHYLSKNPDVLAKMRVEHDEVFGGDLSTTRDKLADSPNLLSQLPYTLAVIKETLRLSPPTGSFRQGEPGFFLHAPGSDVPYPTEGFMVLDAVRTVHRFESAWDRVDEFVPERFLISDSKKQNVVGSPPEYGWRPFEHGPRNCIGQELSMIELKLVLVLVARQFDIECAWDKWDALTGLKEKQMYNGERLYPIGEGTAHCKDCMPVHVRWRGGNPRAVMDTSCTGS